MNNTMAFRADGSNAIGMGHIVNCLAIAAVLKKKYSLEPYFITRDYLEAVQKIKESGFSVITINQNLSEEASFIETITILKKHHVRILVTDLLEIKKDYSSELRENNIKTVTIDILGKMKLQSDIIINRTTLKNRVDHYPKDAKKFLGPKYAGLREQFQNAHSTQRTIAREAKNVIVCLGGGDEFNITSRVARILDQIPQCNTTLVLGKAFKAKQELFQIIASFQKEPVMIEDAKNMADLLLHHDLVICAGGSILYELAITGTPALIIPMNDHQVENAQEFFEFGSIECTKLHTAVSDTEIKEKIIALCYDYKKRQEMSKKGRTVTDGKGTERIAEIIAQANSNERGEIKNKNDSWWHKLEQEVIKPGLCTQCGSCVGLSQGKLQFEEKRGLPLPQRTAVPRALPKICYDACPARYCSYPALNNFLFGKVPENWLTGVVHKAYIGYATEEFTRRNGASGGAISAILIHLLATKKIKGAICLKLGNTLPYKAEPIIARTRQDILACAQSIYSVTPVNTILAQLEKEDGPLAYVGLPDQVASVRKLQFLGNKQAQKIKYLLGPYMGTQMYFEAIRSFLRSHGVQSETEISSLKYRAGEWPGYLEIRLKNGRTLKAEKFYYNYLIPFFVTSSSLQLVDFTNELTDISVGDAWHPKYEKEGKGYSVILSRSKQGEEILQEMKQNNAIALELIPLEQAMDMHGHMLDFKKRGSFIRNNWRKVKPDYGYKPLKIHFSRYCIEAVLYCIFTIAKTKPARWVVEHLPLRIVGPLFNTTRKSWKSLSKPTKRKGLRQTKFVVCQREN